MGSPNDNFYAFGTSKDIINVSAVTFAKFAQCPETEAYLRISPPQKENNKPDFKEESNHFLTVYPNPNSGTLYINYQLGSTKPAILTFYNLLGEQLFQLPVPGNEQGAVKITFNLTAFGLKNGLYFARLTNGESTLVRKVFYLQH